MQPVPDPARAGDTRASADLLRVIGDPGSAVFLTVRPDGRRRYCYWQPPEPGTGRTGCYVALPTAACDALHSAGRITLGEPLVDPARTTYRVRAVRKGPRTPAVSPRLAPVIRAA
ncbi:hypothetical protein [Streptomyces anandii]|uniref:hypothetical protein n=1 Tax=Streptomyces anandii TaxID=285454 RepID=UPI00368C8032